MNETYNYNSEFEDPVDDELFDDPVESPVDEFTEESEKIGGHEPIKDDRTNMVQNPEDIVQLSHEKKINECAIHHEQGQPDVCSPNEVVQIMAKFVETKESPEKRSTNQRFRAAVNKIITSRKVINAAKELLNCNSEACVLHNAEFREFAKHAGFQGSLDAIIQEFFKPEGPARNFGLLSNINIDEVLNQLEKKFPTFYHIPYQMRDFEKYQTELATVNLAEQFKSGKRFFSVVLNTDYTVGPGIHWFCLFGEYKPETKKVIIEYFNSSGESPLPEVQAWIHKTENRLKYEMNVDVDIKYTTGIRFQSDEHSCGVYCIMYIWLRLEGKDFKWFTAANVGDKMMHGARGILFRSNT